MEWSFYLCRWQVFMPCGSVLAYQAPASVSKTVQLISDTAVPVSISISTQLSLMPTNTIRGFIFFLGDMEKFVHQSGVSWNNKEDVVFVSNNFWYLSFSGRLLKYGQFFGRNCKLLPWSDNNPANACHHNENMVSRFVLDKNSSCRHGSCWAEWV